MQTVCDGDMIGSAFHRPKATSALAVEDRWSERAVAMSTAIPTQPLVSPPPTLAPLTPRRITVDEFERIIASGSLNDPKKIELIDGYMVTKPSKSAEHGYTVKEALKAIERVLPAGWTWRKEEPVRIPPHDEPEADITIVRGADADYRHRIPEAIDVGLLVEVAAKSMIADRQQANPYGRSGIPVYWKSSSQCTSYRGLGGRTRVTDHSKSSRASVTLPDFNSG
jgi:Uma2 family endonuclease